MCRYKILSVLSMMFIIVSITFAQDKPMQKEMMQDKDKIMHDDMLMKINKSEEGVAIMGYDPVAYFTDGKAEMGSQEYSYMWDDAEWYFASKEHMMMFKENPDKYVPQYGGYCAYAASKGYYAETDPEAWTIHDGKLYLNHNSDICNVFREDMDNMIMKANMNWKEGKLKEGM